MTDNNQGYTPRHGKTGNTGATRRASATPQQACPAQHAASASGRPTIKHSHHAAGGSYFDHDAKRASGKGRPTRGKGRYIVIAIVVVAVIAVCAFGATHIVKKMSGPAIEPGTTVTVTIDEGSSTKSIAATLKTAGVISDEAGFVKYVTDAGNANSLLPGVYTNLVTGSDNETVMQALLKGPGAAGIALTVPEGYTIEQTAARVEETCGIPAADFITLAHSATTYEADYPFLVGAYDNSLEGYLFPKTYNVPEGATADTVIRLMLDQFSTETASLDLNYATSKGLGFSQVVTMASLIEEEAFFEEDRPHIAGVLYNRLDENMYLGLDVTVYYAIGRTDGSALTSEDLAVDSPYNTYVNKGLPPGPISSPGLASLQAAVSPTDTPDLYFILTSDYSSFYQTYDEFLEGKAAYQAQSNG